MITLCSLLSYSRSPSSPPRVIKLFISSVKCSFKSFATSNYCLTIYNWLFSESLTVLYFWQRGLYPQPHSVPGSYLLNDSLDLLRLPRIEPKLMSCELRLSWLLLLNDLILTESLLKLNFCWLGVRFLTLCYLLYSWYSFWLGIWESEFLSWLSSSSSRLMFYVLF